MKRLAAVLLVLVTGTAFDKPPKRFEGIPPDTKVIPAPERIVHLFCGHLVKAPRQPGARVLGCMLNAKPCIIVVSKGRQFGELVRHEAAHCNGWPKTHPK